MKVTPEYNKKALALKRKMNRAISDYIKFCTGDTGEQPIDCLFIDQDIDDVVSLLKGTPVKE